MVKFDVVKPTDLWYVIGYIATDGSLSIDARHINITSKDREHLENIRNALHLTNVIGAKSRSKEKVKKYFQLQFGDVKFYRYLVTLGITSKKSLTLGALKIESNYFNDFLRGVIDGDGNISSWIHKTNRHKQWCVRIFSASLDFINWIDREISQRYSAVGTIYHTKARGRINMPHTLRLGKIEGSKVLQKVYYSDCLMLKRKYKQAHLCLQD